MQPLETESVKEWRHRRMLSQQELADRAGTSLFTIQRIERGEGSVRPKTGRAVAKALDVPIEELLPKAQAPLWSDEPPAAISEQQRRALNSFEEFCDQLEAAMNVGKLDEPIIASIFRRRFVDFGAMAMALYESAEAVRPALGPLISRFLKLGKLLLEKREGSHAPSGELAGVAPLAATTEDTRNVIDAAERFAQRAS